MPFPTNAIRGSKSLPRQQAKAKRLALEALQGQKARSLSWVTTLTPDEMQEYCQQHPETIGDLAWLVGILRDILLLKQP